MAGANWRPDIWFGLAMNADPNDPYGAPVWSDFTDDFMRSENYARGRDFELDQGMSSAPTLTIRDVDEELNPDNPASTYANLIQPFRPACLLAQWPRQADITGGAVNLFNSLNWRGNKEDRHDGSFDTFFTGQRVTWTTPVGGTDPVVGTTTPFQGARDLGWSVAGTTAQQGFSFPVACIPGRQYTSSIYVRQTTASTQRISVIDQTLAADPFNVTNASTFGTDKLGHAWSCPRGAGAAYSTANLVATIAVEATAGDRIQVVDTGSLDCTLYARLIAPDPATVGTTSAISGVVSRLSDGDNYLNVMVIWRADGTVGLTTHKRVATVKSVITAEVATGWNYSAGQEFVLKLDTRTIGTTVNANSSVWPSTKPQPAAYQNAATATDAVLLTGTKVGLMARVEATITVPYSLRFGNFTAVGYVHGSTTTTTGAYVRLSVTFTATAPQHAIQLATTGTAVAGAVLADAIQHEQGAAASTYIETGPSIYPVFRNLLERYPRGYSSAGFEAYVKPPCVDAMAALASTVITTEYAQAVLDTGPDYYWRLNDGQDTGLFADTSGNGAPPLSRYISKFGAGTDIEPNSSLVVAGSPGGTGVQFTQSGAAGSSQAAATALGTTAIPFPIGVTSSGNWSLSFSCWATLADLGGNRLYALMSLTRDGAASGNIVGIWFEIDSTGGPGTETLMLTFSGPLGSTSLFPFPVVPQVLDGLPHHYAFSMAMVGTNLLINFWLDGSISGSSGSYPVGGWPVGTAPLKYLTIGLDTAGLTGYEWNGVISDVAMWNRPISSTEVFAMYSAGRLGYANESTGGRIARRLTTGQRYTGALRVSQQGLQPDAVQTTMQPASWTGQKDLLSDQQETTTAEQGTFWLAPDGAVVFEDRGDRWSRLVADVVFGENTAAAEVPYLMDALNMDYDSMYVFADVQVGRINGANTVGGAIGDIARARRRYFQRSAGGDFDFANDALPQSMSNWIFYSHNAPMLRIAALELDPVAYPTLWPIVLNLEIGKRVTFKRRAKAANGGAGITISKDFFVEKISIPEIDNAACRWRYLVQLSPINAGASAQGQPTMQPWILGDATYGVLNQTTVLGW